MTRFEQSIVEGYAKKIPQDRIRAKSLTLSAEQALYAAKKLPIEEGTAKSILRELYEGLRQCCEAIGYNKGYKFNSHEVIAYFIEEILKETTHAARFDRYRKIRNGINYYGDNIALEIVKEALVDIPQMVNELKRYDQEV